MATLSQNPCGVSDANQMTISMWCKSFSSVGVVPLLEFGDSSAANYFNNSQIAIDYGLTPPEAQKPLLYAFFSGPSNSIDMSTYVTGDTADNGNWTPDPPPGEFNWVLNVGRVWTPATYGVMWFDPAVTGYVTGNPVDAGKWFHLFVAVDVSNISTVDNNENSTSWVTVMMFINGQNATFGYNNMPVLTNAAGRPLGSGAAQSYAFPNKAVADAQTGDTNQGAEFYAMAPGQQFPVYVEVPDFQISMNGWEFALPGIAASLGPTHPTVDYADVQIWVGQYIDPTVNYSKFVTISGGHGTPVKPSVAAAAFGHQTFLFTGGKSGFPLNRGTGGAFNKIGTITDQPAPSF